MDKRIFDFFRWHHAIYDHFFGNEDDGDVVLYVTPEIIDDIGHNIRDGYDYNNFVQSVVLDRMAIVEMMRIKFGVIGFGGYYRNNNILSFAETLTDLRYEREENRENNQPAIKVPFLNFLVLSICFASQNIDDERGIRRRIADGFSPLQIQIQRIENLFDALCLREPRFSDGRLNNYRYVGRIRYQLILTPIQVRSIQSTLYHFGFEFEDETPFEIIKRRIYNYVADDIRDLLDRSINDEACRRRIEDVIRSFDAESYRQDIAEDDNTRTQSFNLLYAIQIEDQLSKVVLFTDYRPNDNTIVGELNISASQYSQMDFDNLQVNPIPIERPDNLDFGSNQTFSRRGLCILDATPYFQDVLFLSCYEKEKSQFYIETLDLVNHSQYLIAVRRNVDSYGDIIDWLNTNSTGLEECEARISGFDANTWALYYAYRITANYNKENRVDRIIHNSIELKGGIRLPNTRNVYLTTAMPYVSLPTDRETVRVVSLNINGNELQENDYRVIEVEDKFIIDLCNPFVVGDETSRCELVIVNGRTNHSFTYYIAHPFVYIQENLLYRIDKWGGTLNPNMLCEEQLMFGTTINGSPPANGIWTNYDFIEWQIENICEDYYFLNLITSCCMLSESYSINKSTVKKCIRYAATRKGIVVSDSMLRRTIWDLVDNGYLSPNYVGDTKYQLIPSTFISLPKEYNNNTSYHLLSGCVSLPLLGDIISYVQNNNLSLGFIRDNDSSLFMPKQIIIKGEFNFDEFVHQYPRHYCKIINGDLALQMVLYSGTINEYTEIVNNVRIVENPGRLEDSIDDNYPRIRKGMLLNHRRQYSQFIETAQDQFVSPDIPWDWMEVFCGCARNTPQIIATPSSVMIPEKIVIPSLVRRALHLKNMGTPQWKYVFICNNTITDDVLFTKVREYKADANSNLIRNISNVFSDNNIYHGMKVNLDNVNMELWEKEERFKTSNSPESPNYLVRLSTRNSVFLASKTWVALLDNNVYYRINIGDWSVKSVLNDIVLGDVSTTSCRPNIVVAKEQIVLPDRNQYNIRKLIIIRN